MGRRERYPREERRWREREREGGKREGYSIEKQRGWGGGGGDGAGNFSSLHVRMSLKANGACDHPDGKGSYLARVVSVFMLSSPHTG